MTQKLKTLIPVNKSRLHEEIVLQIEKKIISGELAAGDKLPAERELAASLDVNRSTVREALKKLEMLGLIDIHHGDGIYVRNYLESGNLELLKTLIYMGDRINVGILANLLDVRRIMGAEMAGRAALYRTEEHLSELRSVIDSETEETVLEGDLRVHHIIGKASGNLLYVFILNFFNQVYRDYGYLYFDDRENSRRSLEFHQNILDALENRDDARAKKIMADVLLYTEERIYKKYREINGLS